MQDYKYTLLESSEPEHIKQQGPFYVASYSAFSSFTPLHGLAQVCVCSYGAVSLPGFLTNPVSQPG